MSFRRQTIPLLVFLGLLVVAPFVLPEFTLTLCNYVGLYALVSLGLVLLTGIGGLTSFGQAAFVGLGGYTTAYITVTLGLSPWVGLAAGLGLTLVFALALGFITLRLSGHFLPLGTIAWGISLFYLFGNLEFLGGFTGLSGIPTLAIFDWQVESTRAWFLIIWVALLAALWGISNLLDSRVGRSIRALKGGVVMAEAFGIDTARAKILIFALAALLAALSGWLYAHMQRFVNPTPFGINQGIEYLFMAVVGGAAHVWGALLGAAVVTLLKQWLQDILPQLLGHSGNFEVIVFGALLILILQRAREGLWPWVLRLAGQRRGEPVGLPVDLGAAPLPARARPATGTVLLEGRGVTKRFGGLVANREMSLDVKAGEILALIGPNGAGKSTLFNCLSGVDSPSEGEVRFLDQRVDGKSSRQIARLGLSRTFQHVRLLPTLSALDNVAIGAHLRGHARATAAILRLDRAEEKRIRAEAYRQLERVGLADQAHVAAGSLPLGSQRILEIARALAADPLLLLLDEPAAGLRYLEKQALADLLRSLRQGGMGILLVEHDMDFVMGLADRVVVMEFGEKIAEGLPEAVQQDPAVLEAYLGGVD